MKKTRVIILGGVYAALGFEERRDPDFEVTLISQENFFLFTPMLHEAAASDLTGPPPPGIAECLKCWIGPFFRPKSKSSKL